MIRRDFVLKRKMRAVFFGTMMLLSTTIESSIYAGSSVTIEEAQETDTQETDENAKRRETAEKPEFSVSRMKELFSFAGSSGGLDIYLRNDDHLTEDELKEAEKIGAAAAVYSDSGEAAAAFEPLSEDEDKISFISEKGRYIAEISEGRVNVMSVVSTLDNENVYISGNGDIMELRSDDKREIKAVFRPGIAEDDIITYQEDGGERFAWISAEKDRFFGIYRYGAENSDFRMIVDDERAVFGLENKATGYIWWSSPLGATHDTTATEVLAEGLQSSVILNYGIPEKRSDTNTLRSNTDDCRLTVTDIDSGIRVDYDFYKAGFEFPVEYILEEDHLRAVLRVADIQEKKPENIITEITLLENFGAASSKEEGYFVIPDGCGALVRFNNGRTTETNAYKQPVYGNDITAVPQIRGAYTEQICLPVYGIVKEDNALLAVAERGDSNACISAKISGQSNTDYNMCSFNFTLRETDIYYMSGKNKQQITVFESGSIRSDDIEVRYYPISRENAGYADVAARYREYLIEEKNVVPKTKPDSSPLYIDLYGGVEKKRSVLGIPISMKTAVTTYEQGENILRRLESGGVDEMVVSYTNWTNDGIRNKIDTDARPSHILGGKRDLASLVDYMNERDIPFYPVSDNRDFRSGNGYFSFTDTAVRVSGSYSRIVSYDYAYGVQDSRRKNLSLLSPGSYGDVFSDLKKGYGKAGLEGVSAGSLTSSLYGDYSKNGMSRYEAMNSLIKGYEMLCGSMDNGIMADYANAYALPYVSHIRNIPVNSSRFDIFDEDVPFYQMVIHGLIPYTTRAVNGSADPAEMLINAAETGSFLRYDMICGSPDVLEDTEFDIYYYADSSSWTDQAARAYRELRPVLSKISGEYITDRKTENNGSRVITEYSDGSVIITDHSSGIIEYSGGCIYVGDIEEGGYFGEQ